MPPKAPAISAACTAANKPTGSEDSFLRDVIDTMHDGVFVVDAEGCIVMVNPALERLTGYSRNELMGQPCSSLNCEACDAARNGGGEQWCRLFATQSESRKHCTIIRKDGKHIPVLKSAKVLMHGSTVVAAVETVTDMTDSIERDRRIQELSLRLDSEYGFAGMIGTSPAIRRIFSIIERAAQSDAPVIICGQSGTGKELAARAIHDLGVRKKGPYVQLNCAALNESLLESELFGHVKGAFTGAVRSREGRFEAAQGGDIFLDEIGDIPLPTQVKLLRVLESKRIERVGDNRSIDVDVRIISATNRNLQDLVRMGRFREDLLFRINVIPIHLPTLAERREDIPLLTDHFIMAGRTRTGKDMDSLTPEAMRLFADYRWPGNIRELKSAIEYAFVVADSGRIGLEHLPMYLVDGANACSCPPEYGTPTMLLNPDRAGKPGSWSYEAVHSAPRMHPLDIQKGTQNPTHQAEVSLEQAIPPQKKELLDALRLANGNMSETARLLGVHRGTVRNRMLKWHIDLAKSIFA